MLGFIRDGDDLYVHSMARLARNLKDLLTLVTTITDKGVTLHFVKENLTFEAKAKATPFNKLLLGLLGSVAEFERELILERQREGIAQAKARGAYKGRKPIAPEKIEKAKELLAQGIYRQSLITRAVTKGLDPNVEMKDSGVNWIGKIPRNFKTIKLKYCLKSPLQYGATESGCAEEENYIRYIRITDINPSGFLKENGKLYLPKEIAEQYPVKTKDILFARSGATVGKTYFHNNKDDCCFAGYLIKASLSDSKILPKFFYYFTKSACYDFWKDITLSKATIQNISADRLNDLSVVCPPIQDQIQIIKFCDDLINETEAIAEIIKTTCNLLIEYRTSLISAAVTGQLAIEEAAE